MKTRLLFLFLTLATLAKTQSYSFINDRRFYEPNDLIGYDFKPAGMEIKDELEQELAAGEYSFGITMNNLYVKGGDIEGVYNINNIHPEEYGFKLALMNARDARLQGHLKVILNKYAMVELLIFKRSPDEKEIIFYQTPIGKARLEQEKAFFTDRGELPLLDKDSIWGESIRPFHIIHEDARVQQRLEMIDSFTISFIEETRIVEKEKKRSKRDKERLASDTLAFDSLGIDLMLLDSAALDSILSSPEIKVKIVTEYFVEISSFQEYDDGVRRSKSWRYPVKKIVEREDESAGPMEERYQWEFVTDKKEVVQLYLNGDHTVSTMQIGPKKYLMRGF
jgi:hypothetical protein